MTPQRLLLVAVIVSVAGACGGCYDPGQVKAFLREPRSPVAGLDYRILPPDVIQIRSTKVPEINGTQQMVRPDGRINLPLLGEFYLANLTPKQAEDAINEAADKHGYKDPNCTVLMVRYSSQSYYVFGQVARPGAVIWTGHDTVLDALARAQPTTLAWPERIIVVRGAKPTEGGCATTEPADSFISSGVDEAKKEQSKRLVVNLMAMIKAGDMTNNVLLEPNDVIYVQPNPLAAVGLAVQNLLMPIRPAAETVLTPSRVATGMAGAP
ncbi:MAG TPA: polysaccharide biosynthesis/export family protein [Phycisphaerae bacterium]|nr:polysaccharide biosynthesis/export family protein [Phycisphaerae bacterium]